MSRLDGDRIGDARPHLSDADRVRLARSMGETIARVNALPWAGLESFVASQDDLLAERLPRLLKDQRDRGGDDALDAALRQFLAELPEPAPAESVLLHADLTDDHFLVRGDAVVGLIDFADAFVGPWTYELDAPVGFLTHGRPAALRALCEGRGVTPDADLLAAVRAWLVLHRYSHVAIMMREVGASSLEELLAGACRLPDARSPTG
jgi:Ser/Thr protein kinase RdoA (MazF antagonist)